MMPILIIDVTEIMILIKYAWEKYFACIKSNQTAITDQAWFPLNYNLLINWQLQSTMTESEYIKETTSGVVIPYNQTPNYIEIDDSVPILDPPTTSLVLPPPFDLNSAAQWMYSALTTLCRTET